MIIIAWVVLILNALAGFKAFLKVFTDKTTVGRVANFIGCLIAILTCILSIYILRI
nr:MAG TPA: SMODS and SLOG-associating 2TM effector domain family 4 [Caudoviricetes sp.]